MAAAGPSNSKKWSISIFSAFIFLLVVSPMTYKLTQSIFGRFVGKIADANGNPTIVGILFHAFVFLLIVRLTMG